ncbi:MAG: DUF4375 domain-containing protein [Vicinamibacteria bacterium]
MPSDAWFEAYTGQTTDELLALEARYRIDSLVLAFEQAIQQKTGPLSTQERFVLAVEALEREVNNGGYSQFFVNSSNEFVDVIVAALHAIGCPRVAGITQAAIAALGVVGELTPEKAESRASAAIVGESGDLHDALESCDAQFYSNEEPIADRLFAWIKENRASLRLPARGAAGS